LSGVVVRIVTTVCSKGLNRNIIQQSVVKNIASCELIPKCDYVTNISARLIRATSPITNAAGHVT